MNDHDENLNSSNPKEEQTGFFEDLFGDLLNLDTGLPATVWAMIINPGKVVEAYFIERGRYTNPFRYTIILTATAAFFATYFIDYREVYQHALETGAGKNLDVMIGQLSEQVPDFDWKLYFDRFIQLSVAMTEKFTQLTYLFIYAPLMAFYSFIFFKRKKARYVKHLVMMIYLVTTLSLVSIAYVPFIDAKTFFSSWSYILGMPLQLIYTYWVMYKYLDVSGVKEHGKVLLTGILGYISFSVVMAILLYGGTYIWMLLD